MDPGEHSSGVTALPIYVLAAFGRVNSLAWEGLEKHYNQSVFPLTQGMKGLRERQLWRGLEHPRESVFWSLWDSRQEMLDYESSPLRRELAKETEQFYHPYAYAQGETWVKHFEVISIAENEAVRPADHNKEENTEHVMVAWGKLRLGAWDEFEKFYNERVEPTTKTIDGLQERQLLRSTEDPDEGMSVSIWDSADSLLNYARSQLRQTLAKDAEHLYRGEFWVKHFEVRDQTVR